MDVRGQRSLTLLFVLLCVSCAPRLKGDKATQLFPNSQSVKCTPTAIHNRFVVRWKDRRITTEKAVDRESFIEHFLKPNSERIDFVEFDQRINLPAPVMRVARTEPPRDWGQAMVKAKSAWDREVRGEHVTVAVVDTGADILHPQLSRQLSVNDAEFHGQAGVDDDNNGYVDDISGWDFVHNLPLQGDNQAHGTHVAGIILADSQNGPVQGIAPKAKLLPLAFLDSNGEGTVGDAIKAVQYAVLQGAKVINASWGGQGCSETLRDLVFSLEAQGVLFVVAAGNEGQNIDNTPTFPAALTLLGAKAQITVGASSWLDVQADFSNFGFQAVQLVAPGMSIVSTYPGKRMASMDGTSMATPFVSGAAALLWSDRPHATLSDVRAALVESVDVSDFQVQSQGRLDIEKALTYLEQHVPAPTSANPLR